MTLLALAAGVVGYAAFVLIERRATSPLVPVSMLTRRPVVSGAFLVATALMLALFFLSSLYLQQVLGLGALRTGLCLEPLRNARPGSHAVHRLVRLDDTRGELGRAGIELDVSAIRHTDQVRELARVPERSGR